MKINDIIIKPVLTEKATSKAQNKVYTFEVARKANKHSVKGTLISLYGVKIGKVHMIVRKGKVKKVGKKSVEKKLPDQKLALVHVKEGSINVFPQV